jgi:hypothetical protein
MTQAEIKKLVTEQGLTIVDVIKAVIDLNGLTGVGLIDLEEFISDYIATERRIRSKVSAEQWLNS